MGKLEIAFQEQMEIMDLPLTEKIKSPATKKSKTWTFFGATFVLVRPSAHACNTRLHQNYAALEGRYVDVLQRILAYFEGNKSIT